VTNIEAVDQKLKNKGHVNDKMGCDVFLWRFVTFNETL